MLREEVRLFGSAFDCTAALDDDGLGSLLAMAAALELPDCVLDGPSGLVGLVGKDILLWLLVCRRLTAFLSLLTNPAALPLLEEEAADSSILALKADFLLLFKTAACCKISNETIRIMEI